MLRNDFSTFPGLKTERFILREINETDVNEIFFLRSDKEVLRYIKKVPAANTAEALDWIIKIKEFHKDGAAITWGIVPVGAEQVIGTICFWNIEHDKGKGELGYALHPAWQGKGVMQEVFEPVLDYGFRQIGFKLIEAWTNENNLKSKNLLERNNFKRDSELEEMFTGDELSGNVIYSKHGN